MTVSRETQNRLEQYQALLNKWQARINLVAPDTLSDAWNRHFEDSFQLLSYLPKDTKSVVDMGTGAGFPGLVLAISYPGIQVHLIESDAKKCEFLKAVSRETQTQVTVHNARIETVPAFQVDVITARALASLSDLLALSMPYVLINPLIKLIFLKGAQWQDEVKAAHQKFNFDVDDHQSLTSPNSRVLIITNLTANLSFHVKP